MTTEKLLNDIPETHPIKYWFLFLFIDLAISLPSQYFINNQFPQSFENDSLTGFSTFTIFLIVAVLAPVIETTIFNTLFFKVFFKKVHSVKIATTGILLSGIAFGLTHWYSIPYLIHGIFSGIFYAAVYVFFLKRNHHAFLYVASLHSVYNITAFILNEWGTFDF